MERTFFVGVYPGIDEARMDYMVDVFGRFMAGERVAATRADDGADRPGGALRRRMAVVRKIACAVAACDRPRRARLHRRARGRLRRCRASSPGSSSTWRSTPTSRAASGRSPACSRSPARRASATGWRSPTRSRARSRRGWSASSRSGARSGSSCPTGSSWSTPSRDAVLFAGGTGVTAFTAFLQSLEAATGAAGAALLRRPHSGALRLRPAGRGLRPRGAVARVHARAGGVGGGPRRRRGLAGDRAARRPGLLPERAAADARRAHGAARASAAYRRRGIRTDAWE